MPSTPSPPAGPADDTAPERHVVVTRHVVPGVVASSLITLGSWGVGWLPLRTDLVDLSLFDALRTTTLGVGIARAFVIVGGALLLQTWLVLGHDVLSGQFRSVTRMWQVLAAWCAPLLLAAPLFSRDVYSYYAQGKLVAAGEDPYTTGVSVVPGWFQDGVDPMWGEAPTPYGPFFLMLERGIATLVGPQPVIAAVLFRLVALAGVALLAASVPKLAYLHGIDPTSALWLSVLNPLVLMHFVAGVHNDSLMVGLIVAGLTLAASGRPVIGILTITLGAAVKPIALLALPFVGLLWAGARAGWRRRIGRWAATAALSVGLMLVLGLMIGVGMGWVRALSTPGSVRTWLSPSTAIGMAAGWIGNVTGIGDATDLLVGIARGAAMLVAVVIIAWLFLKPEGRSAVRGAGLAFVAVVLLGPVVQVWYLLWALPLLAATGLRKPWHFRAIILGTAGFVIYGLAESSATSDSLFELQDGLAMVFAVAAVGVALLASPPERELVLGDQFAVGLTAEGPAARARASALVIRRPVAPQAGQEPTASPG